VSASSAFADYCGTEHCVGLAAGDALRSAPRRASARRPVLVPANRSSRPWASPNGARSRPVDDGDDYNLDVDAASKAIGERTKYVMPVHPTDSWRTSPPGDEPGRRGIAILEDAPEAHGASVTDAAAPSASPRSFYR
jgi:dTDP-4-amino-4,6-dideoxygalactose transaminase